MQEVKCVALGFNVLVYLWVRLFFHVFVSLGFHGVEGGPLLNVSVGLGFVLWGSVLLTVLSYILVLLILSSQSDLIG